MDIARLLALLGPDAPLLDAPCAGTPKEHLPLPGPDFLERVWVDSDRSPAVLCGLQRMFDQGRLGGTGYLSVLDATTAPDVDLAIEGGCSAVILTLDGLRACARRYAHRIPLIVVTDTPAEVRDLGAVGVIGRAGLGLVSFGGELAIDTTPTDSIDATRARVAASGRVGLLQAYDAEDLAAQVRAAVIHKRAGGMGHVIGRAALALPREPGVALLHTIQDVYRCGAVVLA